MQDIIRKIERKQMGERQYNYSPGDTISVSFRIKEGDKERIQQFQGVVVQTRGTGSTATVTVRKASGNVYVERIFPIYSPLIAEVRLLKRGSETLLFTRSYRQIHQDQRKKIASPHCCKNRIQIVFIEEKITIFSFFQPSASG